MLTKYFVPRRFSTAIAGRHKTKHLQAPLHPRYYAEEFEATSVSELEFVRSPFFELASLQHVSEGDDANTLLSDLAQKLQMTDITTNVLKSPTPTAENVAFTRYADKAMDEKFEF